MAASTLAARAGGKAKNKRALAALLGDSTPAAQVFLLIVMLGNLAEKSLDFCAMPTATRRATAL